MDAHSYFRYRIIRQLKKKEPRLVRGSAWNAFHVQQGYSVCCSSIVTVASPTMSVTVTQYSAAG